MNLSRSIGFLYLIAKDTIKERQTECQCLYLMTKILIIVSTK